MRKTVFLLSLLILPLAFCNQTQPQPPAPLSQDHKAKNVVIIVMDGVRYSEAWGDSTHQYIPHLARLAQQGAVFTNFNNFGTTSTNPGYAAICTGRYDGISNAGIEFPVKPGIFQHYGKAIGAANKTCKIVASKDKLEILNNCSDPDWKGNYQPTVNTGNFGMGMGSGYRDDGATFAEAKRTLTEDKPRLVLIGFGEPDVTAHKGDMTNYLAALKKTDNYVGELWNLLQNDPFYKDQTAVFITFDHGRHSEGVADGFISHGDNCEGCKHILLLATGPDFRMDTLFNTKRSLVDIAPTIAHIMGFEMPDATGSVLTELFLADTVEVE